VGLKTFTEWEDEYMSPINARWTLRKCLEHVEHKWLGMRISVLRSYGVEKHGKQLIASNSRVVRIIYIGPANCALCINTAERWGSPSTFGTGNCRFCPLKIFGGAGACDAGVRSFIKGNVGPMLRLIKKAKKIVNYRKLTWNGLHKIALKLT